MIEASCIICVIGGECVTQQIEGKAGEQRAARIFGGAEEGRERHDAPGAVAPAEMGERRGEAPEQRDQRSQTQRSRTA